MPKRKEIDRDLRTDLALATNNCSVTANLSLLPGSSDQGGYESLTGLVAAKPPSRIEWWFLEMEIGVLFKCVGSTDDRFLAKMPSQKL